MNDFGAYQKLLNLNYPSYPKPLSLDQLSSTGKSESQSLGGLNFQKAFNKIVSQASTQINKPHHLLEQVLAGEKKFDSTELMIALQESQLKLSKTIRVVNDTVRAVKNLEQLQI